MLKVAVIKTVYSWFQRCCLLLQEGAVAMGKLFSLPTAAPRPPPQPLDLRRTGDPGALLTLCKQKHCVIQCLIYIKRYVNFLLESVTVVGSEANLSSFGEMLFILPLYQKTTDRCFWTGMNLEKHMSLAIDVFMDNAFICPRTAFFSPVATRQALSGCLIIFTEIAL